MMQYDEYLTYLNHKDNFLEIEFEDNFKKVIKKKQKKKEELQLQKQNEIEVLNKELKLQTSTINQLKGDKIKLKSEVTEAKSEIKNKDLELIKNYKKIEELKKIDSSLQNKIIDQKISIKNTDKYISSLTGKDKLENSLFEKTIEIIKKTEKINTYLILGIIAIIIIIVYLFFTTYSKKSITSYNENGITVNINGVKFNMIEVKGNMFKMGYNYGLDNQKPLHKVILSDYYIGETEVSFELFDIYCDDVGIKKPYDEKWLRTNSPVINVSWNDAYNFCRWLSNKTGENYRLPTEAEWAYAARGGEPWYRFPSYSGSDLIEEVAWYNDNSYGMTHPVKLKKANGFKIYDMSGNVWEWCSDWFDIYSKQVFFKNPQGPTSGIYKIARGGSWSSRSDVSYCKVYGRGYNKSTYHSSDVGFRLVKDNE